MLKIMCVCLYNCIKVLKREKNKKDMKRGKLD